MLKMHLLSQWNPRMKNNLNHSQIFLILCNLQKILNLRFLSQTFIKILEIWNEANNCKF